MTSTAILTAAYVVCRSAPVPRTVVPSLNVPRVSSDGEPMERAIPADKVASALESLFFTSSAGDVEVWAGISASALDSRKWRITEVDRQVYLDRLDFKIDW